MKIKDVYRWLQVWLDVFKLCGATTEFMSRYHELVREVGKRIAEENGVAQPSIKQLDREIELRESALQAFSALEDYLKSNKVATRRES